MTSPPVQEASKGESEGIRCHDVLCGRGKVDHVGNTLFRNAVAEHLERYKSFQQAKDRHGMGMVVQEIIDQVHKVGGRFIDQNWRGVWVELSEKDRRQKVDRACRDAKKNVRAPVVDDPPPASSKSRDLSTTADAAKSSNSLPPNSLVGLVAASVPTTITDPEPWTYRGDPMPNSTAASSSSLPVVHEHQQHQVQQIWSDLYRYGGQLPSNQSLHTIPNDANDNIQLELSGLEKTIVHTTAPVPVLEYSCGSLVYESSSLCGSDPNDPIAVKPAPSSSTAFLQNSAQWGATSISVMDMNRSAISAMDFSSASLDWLAYENVDDKTSLESGLLDSSVNTMDLNASYKSGLTPPVVPPGDGPARNAHMARYDFLRREESVDTAIAGNLRHHHSHLDESLTESFNMSLDLSAIPPPADAREGSRGPGRLDVLLNNSSSGDWKKKMYGGECSSSGELDVR